MGNTDSLARKYLQNNEIFADAFNMLIYDGRQVIKPENLTPFDTSQVVIPFKGTKLEAVNRYRDVLKLLTAKQTDDVLYLILGIESQTDIHYAMPVRNMFYDAVQYCMQIDELRRQNIEQGKLNSSTFLSGLTREDKIKPVITLTVYFGSKPWDGPISLKEMFPALDDDTRKFIQNYEIFLISPQMQEDQLSKLSSELNEVMQFIKYSSDKDKLGRLLHSDERFAKLSIDASLLLKNITGKEINVDTEKENFNMCKAIDDMIADAKQEGRNEMCKAIDDMIADAKLEANKKISLLSLKNSALTTENSELTSENIALKTSNASLLSENEMLKLELKRIKSQLTN